jgi:phosphoglucomutase/phosphomannomutase
MADLAKSSDLQQALAQIDAAAAKGLISPGGSTNLKAWLTKPAYRDYQSRLLTLVRDGKFTELDRLFWEVIPFGTGGRRGQMAELGSATINERTIAESAQGMAAYLKKVKGKAGGRAVIAYDTRNRSAEFARITATTWAANGLTVFLFDGYRSTPALSFAVRHLQCDIGAMISASHNPPADNGFKAYWSNGAQVLPPHDRGIIECVAATEEIPTCDFDQAVRDGSIQLIGEKVDQAYASEVVKLSLSDVRGVHAVYTPLHGVGETSVYRVLKEAGFPQVDIFEPQRAPDGNFTNVPRHLPNPELTSAFEPAIAYAKKIKADIVLASDPDADRLGVSVRSKDGSFVDLTGNQVGAILVDFVLRKRATKDTLSPEHFITTTLVTTPLFGTIGRRANVTAVDDLLVGFKYIGQTIDARGPEKFVFGAEESLGYLAGTYCRDKDAAIAALYVLELAAELKQQGKTLLDGLDELYKTFGYFLEGQRAHTSQGSRGKEQIDLLMRTFRTSPPRALNGIRIERLRDYREQTIRSIPGNEKSGDLKTIKGDLLFLDSADGPVQFSIAARPSGTEPKIKFYFFGRTQRPDGSPLEDLKAQADSQMHDFQDGLMNWVNGVLDADTSTA